jgi:hypothetical protein
MKWTYSDFWKSLPQPVQAFYQFLIPVYPTPGKKKEYRDNKYKYRSDRVTALIFDETVNFFEIKKDIQQRKQHTEQGHSTLEFSVFVKENVDGCNANQHDGYDENPDTEGPGQVLKSHRLPRQFNIATVKRKLKGQDGAYSGQQEPDGLHSLQHI